MTISALKTTPEGFELAFDDRLAHRAKRPFRRLRHPQQLHRQPRRSDRQAELRLPLRPGGVMVEA